MHDTESVLRCFDRSLRLRERLGDDHEIVAALNNIEHITPRPAISAHQFTYRFAAVKFFDAACSRSSDRYIRPPAFPTPFYPFNLEASNVNLTFHERSVHFHTRLRPFERIACSMDGNGGNGGRQY